MEHEQKHLEMISRGVRPIEPYPGANTPWKSTCLNCGAYVSPRYSTVVTGGKGGCDICAKKQAGVTRLRRSEGLYLEAAAKLNLKPLEPYPGAQEYWLLECLKCGVVRRKKSQGVKQGNGCQGCSSVSRGEAQKESSKPLADEIMKNAGLRPKGPFLGMHKPYLADCLRCQSETSPTPQSIAAGSGGCLVCSVKKRAAKRRDASWTEAEARQLMLQKQNKIDPDARYMGMEKNWPGVCMRCGLPTKSTVARVLAGSSPCRVCSMSDADGAFDFFGPALLYLLFSPQLEHFKLGIMGEESKRLAEHRNHGWDVIETWRFQYGYEANYVEQYVLNSLREEGHFTKLKKSDLPQGGHTETFASSIKAAHVSDLIQSEIKRSRWPLPLRLASGSASQKARRTCTVVEDNARCQSKYYSNGCCRTHHYFLKAYGDPLVRKKTVYSNSTCQVLTPDGECSRPVSRKGMCSVHYYRNYKYGDPNFTKKPTPKPRTGECSFLNCNKEDYSLGLCLAHYTQRRRRK